MVDRGGSRFYRFWMGEVEEQKTERFEVDTSQVEGQERGPPGGPDCYLET
ncbi:MAG: hypothetical protein K0S79_358 [Nitrospira sp.]|jgi:hypothetical protein|nr:hypothetical protein [Nitrospira sp.]